MRAYWLHTYLHIWLNRVTLLCQVVDFPNRQRSLRANNLAQLLLLHSNFFLHNKYSYFAKLSQRVKSVTYVFDSSFDRSNASWNLPSHNNSCNLRRF